MVHKTLRYRSHPVQVGRWGSLLFAGMLLVTVIYDVATAFRPNTSSGTKSEAIAFATIGTLGIIALVRVSRTALIVSPKQIRIVNYFRSHTLSPAEVDRFALGDTAPEKSPAVSRLVGDDRHVLAFTVDKHIYNVGALTLGQAGWGRKGVQTTLSVLNELIRLERARRASSDFTDDERG